MSINKKVVFFGINSNNGFDKPEPSINNLPDWFKNQKRIVKDSNGNDVVTWKACPSLYDAFSAGYVYKTPCDIEVLDKNGVKFIISKDSNYARFVVYRGELPGYEIPKGFDKKSYVWQPNWRTVLPNGYSALFVHPINRNNLPFHTVGGIIDSDMFSEYGSFPFFINESFVGIIPAGTPYMQVIPFKRDEWDSEIEMSDPTIENISKNNMTKKLRVSRGGVYFREFWNKKKYR